MKTGEPDWHDLKILPEHFQWVKHENPTLRKTSEIRFNDRDYQKGHYLKLLEWEPKKGYTGDECHMLVTHVLDDSTYLAAGFVSLSTLLIWPNRWGDND